MNTRQRKMSSSWQPPPSFSPSTSPSPSPSPGVTSTHPTKTEIEIEQRPTLETSPNSRKLLGSSKTSKSPKFSYNHDNNKRTTTTGWAPPPFMIEAEDGTIADVPLHSLNTQMTVAVAVAVAVAVGSTLPAPAPSLSRQRSPPRSSHNSPTSGGGNCQKPKKKAVGWNRTLFVLNQEQPRQPPMNPSLPTTSARRHRHQHRHRHRHQHQHQQYEDSSKAASAGGGAAGAAAASGLEADDDINDNDNDNDDDDNDDDDDDDDSFDNEREIQIPSRAALGFPSLTTSKHDTLIVDRAMLQTRLEWSQLLVSKALKPYRQMICAVDDDLPNPTPAAATGTTTKGEDTSYIEEEDEEDTEDYLDRSKELKQIRDAMLDDPDLNEKEIAAFFEGLKLSQMKIKSLQSQLDGIKAMQTRGGLRSSVVASSTSIISKIPLSLAPIRNTGLPHVTPDTLPPKDVNPTATMTMQPLAESPNKSSFKHGLPSAAIMTPQPPLASAITTTTTTTSDETQAPQPIIQQPESTTNPSSTEQEVPRSSPSKPPLQVLEPRSGAASSRRRGLKKTTMDSRSLRQISIRRIRDTTTTDSSEDHDIRKLLQELEEAEKRQQKLEKQLAQAGVVIAEDIPYDLAKEKVESIARRMGEIGGSDVPDKKLQEEYFILEKQMEKYTATLQLTEEWATEQKEMERQWEASVTSGNEEAIRMVRRHMPVDVRNLSEAALHTQPTPNGKYLPKAIAKKFKRTNVLQLLRIDPEDIIPMHAATLENMRVTGLTLTERRAMYEHLKVVGPRWKPTQGAGDPMTERKWTWFHMMKSNFKEKVNSWQRHVDQYGPPENHPYATRENPNAGCPLLGKQCPLKADKVIDYEQGGHEYGFPEGSEYFKSEVKRSDVDNLSKAKQEAQEAIKLKKSKGRSTALKQHYKGKILQATLANGSCEAMDDAINSMENGQEKWIKARLTNNNNNNNNKPATTEDTNKKEVTGFKDALNELKLSILQFAERSGMQLTGKRDANADQPDIRSMIELALCEEVIETATDFFQGIVERMNELQVRDGRMKSTIQQLKTLLEELEERNLHTMEALGQERPSRSRQLKSRAITKAHIEKTMAREEKAKAADETVCAPAGPPAGQLGHGKGGRGDLLSALKGRGGKRGGPGSGDLLAALQGRCRGGGRGEDVRPGGLMAAIAAGGSK